MSEQKQKPPAEKRESDSHHDNEDFPLFSSPLTDPIDLDDGDIEELHAITPASGGALTEANLHAAEIREYILHEHEWELDDDDMFDPDRVPLVLESQREKASPEHQAEYYLKFEDLWERKLWHELTDLLIEYFKLPESESQRIGLFHGFIRAFDNKINQLKLVNLGLLTAETESDLEDRLSFLEKISRSVNGPSSQEAYVAALSAVASIRIELDDLTGGRKDLDLCDKILDSFDSVDSAVHARFYSVSSDYYQKKQEFASYYKNALLYLACVDVAGIPQQERLFRAYNLAIAALVSDSIYNFGELLLHPILDSLKNDEHAWLRELLYAFNRGDLRAFDTLSGNLSKDDLLKEHQTFLRQKISLSALTEAVFRRPPHDRAMTFKEIRDETNVQIDEIEYLIMRALSLGLLRGTIDQVAQVAEITWVQPKVLDMKQIVGMRQRLQTWDKSVHELGMWMEKSGKEVWAA